MNRIEIGIAVGFVVVVLSGLVFLVRADMMRAERDLPRQEADANLRLDAKKRGVDNCLKRGGVPVFSTWDGRLVDCK